MEAHFPFFMICTLLAISATQAQGNATYVGPAARPLYDPDQLPTFRGILELLTLTPRGDIDGFVLTDGTEVKTPPHLTEEIAQTLRPGDPVRIHGLKAASLPLIQAISVTNENSGRTVVDVGLDTVGAPDAARRDATAATGTAVTLKGRIRMDLHGPSGDVNGVLLADGNILELPPPEAVRLSALLAPSQFITAEGRRRTTVAGSVVELTAIGPEGGPLTPIGTASARMQDGDRRPP